jgi:hypothetical protein
VTRAARGALVAASLLVAGAGAAAGPQRAGTVSFVAGEATRSAGGTTEKLAQGAEVLEGDVVETGSRCRIELRLADSSVVRLGPRSRLSIDRATPAVRAAAASPEDRRFSAKLFLGKLWANVAKAVGGEARFEIETENAVAGVRGTTFRVDAARDGSVAVKVYGGTVAVTGARVPRSAHDGSAQAPARREIPGPSEVTREQWERIVTSMMQVRVSASGVPGKAEAFAVAVGGKDPWEAWNRSRDAR